MKIAALTKTENRVKLSLEFGIIILSLLPSSGATEIVSRGPSTAPSMNYRLKQGAPPMSIPYANENQSACDALIPFLAPRVASLVVSGEAI